MNFIRGLIFNLVYSLNVLFLTFPIVFIGPFVGFKKRVGLFAWWTETNLWYLRLICGIKVRVEGRENIPDHPVVVMANHQSSWETYALYHLMHPVCTVLKKELTYIPIFGWLLVWSRPIVIDRSKKSTALKEVLRQGAQRISEGLSVLIFPEGTRVPVGETKPHQPGGAMLAVKNGVDIVPIVHNAGLHWPAHRVEKVPGEIVVRIGKPIPTAGRKPKEVSAEVEQWMNEQKALLNQQ